MGRILALLALAACLLAAASSEASAWVGFATGIGPGGWGRNYFIIDDQALDAPVCPGDGTFGWQVTGPTSEPAPAVAGTN
jgi:hypothetical protein